MRFLILSRKEMESVHYTNNAIEPHIVVSINDDRLAKIPKNNFRLDELFLTFSDIDLSTEEGILFNTSHAESILNFVDERLAQHEDEFSLIVVHCFAGVCRSVATASALSKILNNYDDIYFKSGVPNMKVYSTILDTYFCTENYHVRWENIYRIRSGNLEDKYERLNKFRRLKDECS